MPTATMAPPRTAHDDGALMASVANGDVDAFGELYDRHAGRVLATVRRVLRDPAQSEEVTQEVFVEAWRQAASYEADKGRLDAWLLTMARRRAIDRVRSEQASRNRNERAAIQGVEREVDTVAEQALASDLQVRVQQALQTLSAVQRQAIEMTWLEGRTYAQVAGELELPLSTVKTRIRDGLLRLRSELLEHGLHANLQAA